MLAILCLEGIETIHRKAENKLRQTLARIEELVKEYEVDKLVLGFPKHMNNTIGDRAEKSLELKAMLERRTGLPVIMWDERLTTLEAERTLIESKVRREDRKKYVDKIAAVLEFFVLEQTKVNGNSYILVTDSEEDEAECLILKDTSAAEDVESLYEVVEDENELMGVLKVFEELLEDIDIDM